MTIIADNRTAEQRLTHTVFVRGVDKFMSGWGLAQGGTLPSPPGRVARKTFPPWRPMSAVGVTFRESP